MSPSLSFTRKAACAAVLVAVADLLFYGHEPGWGLGGFAIVWVAALLVGVPALRRGRAAAVLALAAALGLVLIDDPSPLAWLLFWTATASAALLPGRRFDDAARWGVRLLALGAIGLVAPVRDALRVAGARRSPRGIPAGALVRLLALPLVGGAIFVALFAAANPLIERALDAVRLPDLSAAIGHLIFWALALISVWATFRPRTLRLPAGPVLGKVEPALPVATLILSLATFNAIFALQNVSDLAFLWSGARLPAGLTMTEYVHRGAYPLIATALLAGMFVIVALRPGSPGAAKASVRRLVTLWVLQNVVLVASSVLRTLRYIGESMLTEWRIAALAWMGLVALGLGLILWRLLHGRSAAWLVNANAAAAAVVLLAASVVDLGAIAARWNVDHAHRGDRIDLCYLAARGPSALLPLIDLERRAGGPVLRDRVRFLRLHAMASLAREQADPHSWTWRGARRIAAARTRSAGMPTALRPAPNGRACDGGIVPPPQPDVAPAPLTGGPRP